MNSYSWKVCDPLLNTSHTLIAGTTGSGKSVLMNSTIHSAICKGGGFYFIDLKRVELSRYKNIQGCCGFCTEPEDVLPTLDEVIGLMESRYKKMKGVLYDGPNIYVFIDELADLVSQKGVLERLTKIGRLGRAAKIHLICATQDPSRKTLKAQLMQNFTCTVALRCRSAIESRQIVGVNGAEKLPEYGEAFRWDSTGVHRFCVPKTPEDDIISLVQEIKLEPKPSILRKLFWWR